MECVCQEKSVRIHVGYLSGIALLALFTFNQNLAWAEYKPVYGLDCKRPGKYPVDFGLRWVGLYRFIAWRSIYPAGVHGGDWLDGH